VNEGFEAKEAQNGAEKTHCKDIETHSRAMKAHFEVTDTYFGAGLAYSGFLEIHFGAKKVVLEPWRLLVKR
jgi:hypothetical protein